MKRILPLLAFVLLASAAASAQGIRYGVTGALNVSSFSMSSGGLSIDTDSRLAFNAGFKMELGFSALEGLYMDSGALLSAKGSKYTSMADGESADNTVRPHYLEIPIHIGYRYALGGNLKVFGSFGPYFAIGLFGKAEYDNGMETLKSDVFGSDGMKRFDFGLGLRGGMELFDHYQIFLGYDWGLVDASNVAGTKIHNRNFYIGAAYLF